MIAAKRGDFWNTVDSTRFLLNAKAEVNARSKDGHIALTLACSGRAEHVHLIVKLLLAADADVNAVPTRGNYTSTQHFSIS